MRAILITTLFAVASVTACSGSGPHEKQDAPHAHHAKHSGHDHKGHSKEHGHKAHPEGAHKHEFKTPETWAERWNDPGRDAWQKPADMVALLEIEPGMKVADLGAGTGYLLPHLAQATGAAGSVLALDIQPEMLAYLEARVAKEGWSNVKPHKVPMDGPGLAPNSLDRLVTLNTWHHIQDREAYAAKVKDTLKPGGLFMIVDYTLDAEPGPPKAYRLPPEAVVKELKAGGLMADVAVETLPRHYIIIGRKPAE